MKINHQYLISFIKCSQWMKVSQSIHQNYAHGYDAISLNGSMDFAQIKLTEGPFRIMPQNSHEI